MGVRDTHRHHDQLLQELAAERMAALTRIARTLESLIEQLRDLRARLMQPSGASRAEVLEQYRALRARALQYRWYLEVQREAVGLRHQRMLDEFYAVPGPIEI